MHSDKMIKKIIKMSILAGKIMLENGAETYRVEDTINRLCESKGIIDNQIFVTPTGIFFTAHYNDELYSTIERVKDTKIDLHIIAFINDFSRKYVKKTISIEDAFIELEEIKNAPQYPLIIQCLFGGLSGGFFALMFGGGFYELLLAFITSFSVILSVKLFVKLTNSFFLKNILGGMVNTVVATLLTISIGYIGIKVDIDKIIIGSIMPLVPGVAFTDAIRDTLNRDFVSGSSRLLEALIIAIAVAIGVGLTLHVDLIYKMVV